MKNEILNNAISFDYAYSILHNTIQNVAKNSNEKGLILTIPVAVNCAFACELFLKSMLPEGTKGHELKDLFDNLEPSLKNSIESVVILILNDLNKNNYSINNFENDLSVNSNVFNEWRYCHEKMKDISFGVQFMYVFEQILKTFALKDR